MSQTVQSKKTVRSRHHVPSNRTGQQGTHAVFGAVAGNTARALSFPEVSQPQPARRRTPLSVVPARPSRGRVPFAVFSMLALVAALVVVLMLNISVSSSQYKLVSLRGEEVALAEQNQALTQQLEGLRAPQNLAMAAGELDMVASQTFGSIDVGSLSVTGSPEPAKESDAPPVLVPAPAVNTANEAPAPVDTAEAASTESAEHGPAAQPSSSDRAVPNGDTVEPAPSAASEPTNGGTIPAPQQAVPGQ